MADKIKESEEVIKVYTIHCPLCDLAIKGRKPSQVEYLLDVHLIKCRKTYKK